MVTVTCAVAVAEIHGPAAAPQLVDDSNLGSLHLFHGIRGDLLDRLEALSDEANEALLARRGPAQRQSGKTRYLRARRRTSWAKCPGHRLGGDQPSSNTVP